MPRRRVAAKRKILPDPKYQDRLVTKFVNVLMRKGKKSIAERVTYGAFILIEERAKEDSTGVSNTTSALRFLASCFTAPPPFLFLASAAATALEESFFFSKPRRTSGGMT